MRDEESSEQTREEAIESWKRRTKSSKQSAKEADRRVGLFRSRTILVVAFVLALGMVIGGSILFLISLQVSSSAVVTVGKLVIGAVIAGFGLLILGAYIKGWRSGLLKSDWSTPGEKDSIDNPPPKD